MNDHISVLLRALRKELLKDKRVLFSYIYGSLLKRQDARDIDVAVFLQSPQAPWQEAQNIAGNLEKAIHYAKPVDVHALHGATASFRFQVLSTGRLLCDKNKQKRLNWEAHTLSLYQDIKPMLDFHDRRYLSL